ncbi:hypothetical protein F4780DRAFT_767532, partial [Xylariomycetidae sp. FL0641]
MATRTFPRRLGCLVLGGPVFHHLSTATPHCVSAACARHPPGCWTCNACQHARGREQREGGGGASVAAATVSGLALDEAVRDACTATRLWDYSQGFGQEPDGNRQGHENPGHD